MSRHEFPAAVKRAAITRAAGQCEAILPDGMRCPCVVGPGRQHFDHVIPDWMGGKPTIENCALVCVPCHKEKTAKRDVPAIAKAKRIIDAELGIRNPSRLKGRGFRKAAPKCSASRPIEKRCST